MATQPSEGLTQPSSVGAHVGGGLLVLLLAGIVASLGLAGTSALGTVVIGLMLFGILHAVLELRYVVGRYSGLFRRDALELLLVLATGIAVTRLLAGFAARPARLLEISLALCVLGVAAWRGLDRRRRDVALALLVPVALVSLAWPSSYVVLVGHLHHLVTLVFLWEWSGTFRSTRRRLLFRAVNVLWLLVVPAAILGGLLDSWLNADPSAVRSVVGDGASVLSATIPPGFAGTVAGERWLMAFAFLQTMHYVVWVAVIPRYAPEAAAALEARVPWLTGARVWAIGFLAAAVVAVLLVANFELGTTIYSAAESYHIYLELPVVLVLLAGGRRRSGNPLVDGPLHDVRSRQEAGRR